MGEQTLLKHLQEFSINNKVSRLGNVFKTKKNNYFYDSGTGKVFACEKKVFELLTFIFANELTDIERFLFENDYTESVNILLDLIEKHNILKLPIYRKFNEIEEGGNYDSALERIILELTENCNLTCKYCIYQDTFQHFRGFSKRDMPWEIAKKSIDYAFVHAHDDLIISFYGGEPLLKWDLMKKSIEYAMKMNVKFSKRLSFYFTTNGVLITKEIANYLSRLDSCYILCSIDGPADVHDECRVDALNQGSFHHSIRGLKYLVDAFQEKAEESISIHSVIYPPFDEQKLDYIKEYFDSIPWLLGDYKFSYSYTMPGSYRTNEQDYASSDSEIKNDPVKSWMMHKLCDEKDSSRFLTNIESYDILKIHDRMLLDSESMFNARNACCDPGKGRLYVTVDGKFRICERVGNTPYIGDIDNGLDKVAILHYYKQEYDRVSFEKCNDCWAVHLCPVCYVNCCNEKGIDQGSKDKVCDSALIDTLNCLYEYHRLYEERPDFIKDIIRRNKLDLE